MCVFQLFFASLWFVNKCILSTLSLAELKLLNLMVSNISFFSFMSHVFAIIHKKVSYPWSSIFSSMLFFKTCIALHFMLSL